MTISHSLKGHLIRPALGFLFSPTTSVIAAGPSPIRGEVAAPCRKPPPTIVLPDSSHSMAVFRITSSSPSQPVRTSQDRIFTKSLLQSGKCNLQGSLLSTILVRFSCLRVGFSTLCIPDSISCFEKVCLLHVFLQFFLLPCPQLMAVS